MPINRVWLNDAWNIHIMENYTTNEKREKASNKK